MPRYTLYTLVCVICDRPFFATRSDAMTCSDGCRKARSRVRKRRRAYLARQDRGRS